MSGEFLIHCRSHTQAGPAQHLGLGLAARTGARANGLYVVSLYPAAFATPETVALTLTAANSEYDEARAAAAFWHTELGRAGVSGDWLVCEDDPVEALARASLLSDLVVMERPTLSPEAPTGWGLVSRAAFACSVPVLVVPDCCSTKTAGTVALIAWNGSREAARALEGALPVLRWADRIVALDGSGQGPASGRRMGLPGLKPWLERHGLKTEIRELAREGAAAGPAILETAQEVGADLIVMGAWGHARLAELILGGVTRYLFQHSDRPMLVAH